MIRFLNGCVLASLKTTTRPIVQDKRNLHVAGLDTLKKHFSYWLSEGDWYPLLLTLPHPLLIDQGGEMFTPLFTTAIPLRWSDQSTSQAGPRQLQAIELVALSIFLVGVKMISNHLVNILLNQFIGG